MPVPRLIGRLAYLQGGAAYVAPAAGGGPATRLLPGRNAWRVTLSPANGTALVFTAPAGAPASGGFASRPPYREARLLPFPLHPGSAPEVVWSGNGERAFCTAETWCGVYRLADNAFQRLRFPTVHSATHDGRVVAWATDDAVVVGWTDTGKTKTLFSTGRPAAVLAALRAARRPDRLQGLADPEPTLWRDPNNWQIGAPALTPDGKKVLFAANAGQGMGASANTTFCFFAADVATGRLAVLSKLGAFFGRVPAEAGECAVSPEGGRLLFLSSAHSSAVENPRSAYVVDLLTQNSRELLHTDPAHRKHTNLTDGACWSPDGRQVAVSVLYYDVSDVLKTPNWEPRERDYALLIKDAATGRTLRRIPGARRPSWSR